MKKLTQRSEIVSQQFENQIGLYADLKEYYHSPISTFLISALKRRPKTTKPFSICEFGGGGGQVLAETQEKVKQKLDLTNCELTKGFRTHQALPSIKFRNISLLQSGFADNSFDAVCVRHVIHHLIGSSLADTRKNQQFAIHELVRITKPGGYILIEEQVNYSVIATHLYFYLSQLATKLKLSIPAFQITPYTIVGYLTRFELLAMAEKALPKSFWVKESYEKWPYQWLWKLTMLMRNSGAQFIVMQKPTR